MSIKMNIKRASHLSAVCALLASSTVSFAHTTDFMWIDNLDGTVDITVGAVTQFHNNQQYFSNSGLIIGGTQFAFTSGGAITHRVEDITQHNNDTNTWHKIARDGSIQVINTLPLEQFAALTLSASDIASLGWIDGFNDVTLQTYDNSGISSLWVSDPVDVEIKYSISTVPVPTAVWLFGSGLICLAGLARRKNT